MVLPDTTTSVHRKLIVWIAQRHKLPAIYPFRFFVADGGLVCYGIDVLDVFKRAASPVTAYFEVRKPVIYRSSTNPVRTCAK